MPTDLGPDLNGGHPESGQPEGPSEVAWQPRFFVVNAQGTRESKDFPFQQHPGVLDRWSRDCGCQQPAYNKDCFPRLGCVVAAEIDTVELDKCIGAGAAESLRGIGEQHLMEKPLLLDGRVPFTFLKPEAPSSDADKSQIHDGFILLASTVPGDVLKEHYGLLKELGFAMESAAEMTRLPPGMASDSQLVKAAQKIFRSSNAYVDECYAFSLCMFFYRRPVSSR